MRRYIFFDFDGTISDARRLTYSVMIDVLDELDFNFSKFKLKKLMGCRIQKILSTLGVEECSFEKIRRMFYSRIVKNVSKRSLSLCSDVKPLYELKKQGFRLIVISNAEKSFINSSIKVLSLKNLFYGVYGGEDFLSKDEILKKLIKEYKIKPKHCFYIGDRFSDIDYAHRAHLIAVAIHNKCSWSTKKEIIKEKPDYIISDFEDLLKIVKREYS